MLSVVYPDAPTADILALAQLSGVELLIVGKREAETRAGRLNLGIARAKGEMILLHHPRSRIESAGIESLIRRTHEKIWGGFTHRFDVRHPLLSYTSWYTNQFRPWVFRILYLDHCIFFHKSLLREPIPEVPVFEDTLLSYKLRLYGRPVLLPYVAVTSAIRYQKNGYWKQALMNQALKIGFHVGISPITLNHWYEKGLRLN